MPAVNSVTDTHNTEIEEGDATKIWFTVKPDLTDFFSKKHKHLQSV